MKKEAPSRLGRGLSALIPPTARVAAPAPERPAEAVPSPAEPPALETTSDDRVQELPMAAITPNTFQPRTAFDEAALDDLAASILAHGVLQPVMVRPSGRGRYELVAGERRFRAAEKAGLTRIPAIVRDISDEESLVVALIENIQREDLNAIESARGYQQLLTQFRLTQTELARQIGKAQPTIANALSLLKLPAEVQDSISAGHLTSEHGKVLLQLPDEARILSVWRQAISGQLSVRETRDMVKHHLDNDPAPSARLSRAKTKDVHWQALEDQFRTALGMRIELRPGRTGRGTLTIEFSTDEEIDDLLSKLNALE